MCVAKMAAPLERNCMALVRCMEDETHLTISFVLRNKLHKLYRPKDELVNKTLKRLSLTLAKKGKKKGKETVADSHTNSLTPAVSLQRNELEMIPMDTPNAAAWQTGSLLIIDELCFEVFVNYPQMKKLELPDIVMVGCPIIPQVEVEFASKSLCKWAWFRLPKDIPSTGATDDFEKASLDPTYSPPSLSSGVLLHEQMIHWPTLEDLNVQLLLKCIPYNSTNDKYGNPVYCHAPIVQDEPPMLAILNRQKLTPSLLPVGYLRVVSYNVLADQHASSEYSQNILYPYCKPIALTSPYRHGLLVKELIGYRPDIICLQEVAQKCFDFSLEPVLRGEGYGGHYARKTGQLQEGEAIFFHLSKYKMVDSTITSLAKFLCEDPWCSELLSDLQKAPTVLKSLKKKPTIIQLVLLKVAGFDERYLLVSNTHLCFHPSEDHIRLFQAIICTRAIAKMLAEFKANYNSVEVAVMFCGDLNSCPCTGGYEFLTQGFLPASHFDWTKYKYSLIPRCGCCKVPESDKEYIVNLQRMNSDEGGGGEVEEIDDENVTPSLMVADEFNGIDAKHKLNLKDACSPLAYTHYRDVFVAVLDYILVSSDHFAVDKVVPMPSHEEVTENTALPSISFPSDHLAIMCELKWK